MTPAIAAALIGYGYRRPSPPRVRPAIVYRFGAAAHQTDAHVFNREAASTAWIAKTRGAQGDRR